MAPPTCKKNKQLLAACNLPLGECSFTMDAAGQVNMLEAMRRVRRMFDRKFDKPLVHEDSGWVRTLREDPKQRTGNGRVSWEDVSARAIDFFRHKFESAEGASKSKWILSRWAYEKFKQVFDAIDKGEEGPVWAFLESILRHSSPMLPGAGSSH